MVLGGQHRVFHSRKARTARKIARVKHIGVEMLEIYVVCFIGDPLPILHPFVTGGHSLKTKVNEHTEAVVNQPIGLPGGFASCVR